MNLYSEFIHEYGYIEKRWNYCHPSGHAGLVIEEFYPSGQLHYRIFILSGQLHRPVADGPAHESFYESGQLCYRHFYVDGKEVVP